MHILSGRRLAVITLAALTAFAAGSASAQTSTIYNTLGGAENGGDSFKSAGHILVDEVLNGATSSTLSSVDLNVLATKAGLASFDVVVTQIGANGIPRVSQVVATVADNTLTSSFNVITVTPVTTITLAANTHYYVGISKHSGGGKSTVVLGNTVDPSVLTRKEVVGGYYYNNGGPQPNSNGPYELRVKVTPAG